MMQKRLRRFLESWLAPRLPHKIIGEDCPGKGPLMIRYFLLRTPWFNIYLHKFLRSDERTMHDHPWWFWSLVLCGWYIEHTPPMIFEYLYAGKRERCIEQGKAIRRYVGSLVYRPAKWAHRVELPVSFSLASEEHKAEYMPVWSLVLVGKKSRDWGFWEKGGWRKHEEHVTDCGE